MEIIQIHFHGFSSKLLMAGKYASQNLDFRSKVVRCNIYENKFTLE